MKTLSENFKEIDLDKRIIVFYFPFKIVSGGPTYLTNLAIQLSEMEEYSVYYIEYKNGMGRNKLIGSKVKVIDYEKQYKFKLFPEKEIILITPIYWGNRVPILNKNAKIVFFNWHNLCIPSLKEALQCNDDILKKFLMVVSENTAEFYCDKAHWLAQEKYGVHFKELYVPVTIPEREKIAQGDLVDCRKINIAVLGRLVVDKVYAIIDLIENIINTIDVVNKEINIYVIGDGDCRKLLDKYLNLKNIKISMLGTLDIKLINDFLVNNVDLLFAMGTSVLEGAVAAIPSIVIPNDICEFKCNRYTYLYECKDFLLGWDPKQIDEFKIKTHTIKDIIDEVYDGKKREIGYLCRKYYQENHTNNLQQFISAIEASTLTYGEYRNAIEKVKRATKIWINNIINEMIDRNPNKNIVIWGAGKGGRKLAKKLEKMNFNVDFFVDKNAINIINIDGIEVKSTNFIDVRRDIVFISLMSYVEDIPNELIKKGFIKGKNYIYVYFANY